MTGLAGTIGLVRCVTRLGEITSVSILNDRGGTSWLPEGFYVVRITRAWHDYEIGWRCWGDLLSPADVELSRQAGVTGHPPTQPLQPARVFFALDDFRQLAPGGPA
jgi:hypothetical protein